MAKAAAARGDNRAALAALAQMSSVPALEERASLAAKTGDWRASLDALNAIAATKISSEGELSSDQQDLVMRQAVAACRPATPPR